MSFWDTPTLEGPRVRLEPLGLQHTASLASAVSQGDLWRTWYTRIPAPNAMAAEIERRMRLQGEGKIAPWAICDTTSRAAVGMTSFLHLDEENRRLEIGATWLGRGSQATGMNGAAKLLLLGRAFDDLGCIAVEFRTHWHNHQSRRAIERLGAKQDGVLRNHTLLENGTIRDTVVFSILDREWPTVRCGLLSRLQTAR